MSIVKNDIKHALDAVGVVPGQVLLIHSDLAKLGPIGGVKTKQEFVRFHFESIASAVDLKQTTILVPTFTYSFARTGKPFDRQSSPSEVCMLSEYVRTRPGAARSMHPLNSFAALGPKSSFLCENLGRSCWGYNSVFDRFLRASGKVLFYGASLIECTLMFYVEQLVGVSHCYHKAYFGQIFDKGKSVPGPFMAFVRYLNGKVSHDFHRFAARLHERGLVRTASLGRGTVSFIDGLEMFEEAVRCLEEDPCFFLKEPYYVTE